MKYTFLFAFLLCFSFAGKAQEVLAAANEPASLYREANQSLSMGNTKLAINIFQKVIDYYKQEGMMKALAENYLGMALSFAFNGNYEESISYHKKALRAHKKYRSAEPADAILLNLGLTYQLAGKERKARKYLN